MKPYSNIYEVKMVCCVQERLLSLSQLLSYIPLIILFPTSKKLEGHIASGTFVRACVRASVRPSVCPSVTLFDA